MTERNFIHPNIGKNRYKAGGNSGSGSYSNLAIFKAEIINSFVKDNKIESVIEFGCGDGQQLKLFDFNNYIGFDVSSEAIKICMNLYDKNESKRFKLLKFYNNERAELTISLDVIYHLTEDNVFQKYMQDLFSSASMFVIIYSSNFDEHNTPHVKHREFTKWISESITGWKLHMKIKNDYPFKNEDPDNTSYSDFFIYRKE